MAFPRISRLFRRAPSNRMNKVGLLRKQSLPLRMVNLEERVTPAISITSVGNTYSEDFNSLLTSGSGTWTNDNTVSGWYHARTGTGSLLVANDGGSNGGALYSYGTGTTTDRALGSLGSSNATVGSLFWGAAFVNITGVTITSLDVSYTGEQWRNSAASGQSIAFSYLVGSPAVTGSLAEFQAAGVAVPSLDFTSPITAGTAGKLDGNLAANRVAKTFTISGLSIPNGTEFMLRWSDPDHSGSDHGLSIDTFSLTPFAAANNVTLDVANNVVIDVGDGRTDDITVSLADGGTNFLISDPNVNNKFFSSFAVSGSGTSTIKVPASGTAFYVKSGDLGDRLRVSLSGGSFSHDVLYVGGSGTDSISLESGVLTALTVYGTDSTDGFFDFGVGSHPITFLGTEASSLAPTSISSLTFVLPAVTPSIARLQDDGTSGNNLSQLVSTNATFVPLTFPSTSLEVKRADLTDLTDEFQNGDIPDQTDSIAIGTAASPFHAAVVGGAMTLGSGNYFVCYTVNSLTVSPTGNIATSGTGTITLSSQRVLAIQNGARLSSVDGDISLSANQQVPATTGDFTGIDIDGAFLQAVGTGSISILGTGGDSGAGDQFGLRMSNAVVVSKVTVGYGRAGVSTGGSSTGISVSGGSFSATTSISLDGTGGQAFTTSRGVSLPALSTWAGTLSLTGHASVAPDSTGVFVTALDNTLGGGTINGTGGPASVSSYGVKFGGFSSWAGTLAVTGSSAIAHDAAGVFVDVGGQIISSLSTADVSIKGDVDQDCDDAKGVYFRGKLSGFYGLTLVGNALSAIAKDASGVFVDVGAEISGTGAASISGKSDDCDDRSKGVDFRGKLSGFSALTMVGESLAVTAKDATGVFVDVGAEISGTGAASISGKSDDCDDWSKGVDFRGKLSGFSALTMVGEALAATAKDAAGVFIDVSADISGTGTASISGTSGGTGTSSRFGVKFGGFSNWAGTLAVTGASAVAPDAAGVFVMSGAQATATTQITFSTSSLRVDGALTVTAGTLSVSSPTSLTLSGTGGSFSTTGGATFEAVSGTFTAQCTVTDVDGDVEMRALGGSVVVTGDLLVTAGTLKVLSPSLTVDGQLEVTGGDLFVTGSASLAVSGTGKFKTGPGHTTLTATSGDLTVGGSWTVDGDAFFKSSGNILGSSSTVAVAGRLDLTATGGSIGTSASRLKVDAFTIKGSASSSGGSIYIEASKSIAVGDLNGDGAVDVLVIGALTVTGNASSNTEVSMQASGLITQASSLYVMTAPVVLLASTTGTIGAPFDPIRTNPAELRASAPNGSVYVETVGSATYTASSAGDTFSLTTGAPLTTNAAKGINAPNLLMRVTGSGNGITVDSDLSATTSLTLIATTGSITQVSPTFTLTAPQLTVTARDAFGNAGQAMRTNVGKLIVVVTDGDANVGEFDSIEVIDSSASGSITLEAGGHIKATGSINSGTNQNWQFLGGGGLTIAGDLTSASGKIKFSGLGDIKRTTGTLFASEIEISTTGSVGEAALNKHVFVNNFDCDLSLDITGPVFITATGSVTFPSLVVVGGTFDLSATDNINLSSIVRTSPAIGTGGNIIFVAGGGITGGGQLESKGGTGGNGGDVSLTATTGSISLSTIHSEGGGGGGSGGAVFLAALNGNVVIGGITSSSTNGDGGSILIEATGIMNLGPLDSSTAGGTGKKGGKISVETHGATIVADTINSRSGPGGTGGDVTIVSSSGSVTTSAILADGPGTGTGGQIKLDAGTSLTVTSISTMGIIRGDVTLICDTTASLSGVMTAGGVVVSGAGRFEFPSTSNDFTKLASSSTNVLVVGDNNGFVIDTVGGVVGVVGLAGFSMNVGGTVTQNQPIEVGEIQLLSFSFGKFDLGTKDNKLGRVSGNSAGEIDINDISTTLRIDKSSPILFLTATDGLQAAGNVTIKTTGAIENHTYLKVTLNDVFISGYSYSSSGSTETYPLESVSLNFTKITYKVGTETEAAKLKVQKLSADVGEVLNVENKGALEVQAIRGGWDLAKAKTVSPMTVTGDIIGPGAIILIASEDGTPGAGDELTIKSGVKVQSTSSTIELRAGDNIVFEATSVVDAFGTMHIEAGSGNNDAFATITADGSITSGGHLTMIGDDMAIGAGAAVSAGTNSATLRPQSASRAIDVGTNTAGQLGLLDTELDKISAGTIVIGDSNSGNVTVSANITRTLLTNMRLNSGGDVIFGGGSINTNGGTLLLDPGASPKAVMPTTSGTDATADVSFLSDLAINITGNTVDTAHSQLNVTGKVDLTNAVLQLTGSYAFSGSDTLTIVSADTVTSTFFGQPNGSTILFDSQTLVINYTPTSVTLTKLVVVTGTMSAQIVGNDLVVTDTDGTKNNAWSISFDGTNFVITDANEKFASAPAGGALSNGDKTLTILATAFSGQITFSASGGNDALFLDGSANAMPRDISFDGGAGSDLMSVKGGGSQTATYTPSATTFGDGTVAVSSKSFSFTSLAPVDIFGFVTVTISSPAAASNNLVINSGLDSGSNSIPALVISGNTGLGMTNIETAHLWNNTTVILDTSATTGPNTITVSSAVAVGHNNTNLTLTTTSDANGSASIGFALAVSGALTIQAPTVYLNANLSGDTLSGTATDVDVQSNAAQIQDALDIAASGATVDVAAGAFSENLTLSKRLTLSGAGSGANPVSNTVITAANPNVAVITVSSGGSSAALRQTIQNMRVTGATLVNNAVGGVAITTPGSFYTIENVTAIGNYHGIILRFGGVGSDAIINNSTAQDNLSGGVFVGVNGMTFNDFQLTNSTVAGNDVIGFAFNQNAGTMSATNYTISDTTFTANGDPSYSQPAVPTPQLGRGDISFFFFNGNAALTNVNVNGLATNGAHIGVQFRGHNTIAPGGTVTLTNVSITGSYVRPINHPSLPGGPGGGLFIQNYSDVSNFSFNNVDVLNTEGHQLFVAGVSNTLNLGDTEFGATLGAGGAHIALGTTSQNPTAKSPVNIGTSKFGGLDPATATTAQLFALSDKIVDGVDIPGTAGISLKAGNVYVTPSSFQVPNTTAPSLQRAVDVAANNDTVNIQAGTYVGQVSVNKPLTLLGAQAGNSATSRFAAFVSGPDGPKASPAIETIILPAVTNPDGGNPGANDLVRVLADNITIDGLVIDGNNPALGTSTLTLGGVKIDARRGVTNISSANTVFLIDDLLLTNNIIQNFGEDAVTLTNRNIGASGNNSVNANVLRNAVFTGVFAGGDCYVDVSNNTIDTSSSAGIGIWQQNNSAARPGGATTVWANNSITVGQAGFGTHINLMFGAATPLQISNNVIQATGAVADDADGLTWGINVWSVAGSAVVTISGNTVGTTGGTFGRGINVWNAATTNPVSISGGTIGTKTAVGINVDSVDAYFGNAIGLTEVNVSNVSIASGSIGVRVRSSELPSDPAYYGSPYYPAMKAYSTSSVRANLTNVTISGATTGVLAYDRDKTGAATSDTFSASVQLNAGNQISGATTGVRFDGPEANIIGLTLNNLQLSSVSGSFVVLANGAMDNSEIDGTAVTFNGKTGATATLAENFVIEDGIGHATDFNTVGFVRVKAATVFVTTPGTGPTDETIQNAIDAATSGDTVHVQAGTFDEVVNINKPLTLLGAASHASLIAPTTGSQQSVLTVSASNVTIDGMAIRVNQNGGANPIAPVGISAVNNLFDDLTIQNTKITSIGSNTTAWTGSPSLTVHAAGIVLYDTGAQPNVTLTGNDVNITSGASFFQRAVWLAQLQATITGNTLRGAINDILFQFASGGSSLIDTNNFFGFHLPDAGGVQIAGPNANSPITISNNAFAQSSVNPAFVQIGLVINQNHNGATSPITIVGNSFTGEIIGIQATNQTGVVIDGNTFTPAAGLPANGLLGGDDFFHIVIDSKSPSSGASTSLLNDADIKNNIFNAAAGSEGSAVVVANTLPGGSYGTVLIGVNGDNTYNAGLRQGIRQTGGNSTVSDKITGATTGVMVSGGTLTLASTNFDGVTDNGTDLRIDATAGAVTIGAGNSFAGDTYFIDNQSAQAFNLVSSGNTFDEANNFRIEDKLFHATDSSSSGLIRIVAGQLYVTTPGTGASAETIQNAVNAATGSDTVNVESGKFVEDVTIGKSLTLLGAGAGVSIVSGAIGGGGTTLQVAANNVTITGFTITREGNNTTDWNSALNLTGIAVQGAVTGLLVHDNLITGNRTGIDINNSNGHTIRNNVIDFNRTGMIMRNQTDNLLVTENAITNNWTAGVLFLDASGGSNSPVQQALGSQFFNNNISANWYGQIVDRQVGGSLPVPGTNPKDFSGNWFGTSAPAISTANSMEPGYAAQIPVAYGGTATPPGGQPDILGPASANFDVSPWLNFGADTNVETTPGRGTYGFQGDFSSLTVTSQGTQVGASSRMQEAIDLIANGTLTGGNRLVLVLPGSYTGSADVNKAMTLTTGQATSMTGNLTLSAAGATLTPGFSPAQVTVVDFTAGPGSFTNFELDNSTTPGTGYDQIVASGNVVLNGTSTANVSKTAGYYPAPGSVFTLINNTGSNAISGTFSNLIDNSTIFFSGVPFLVDYQGGTGNDLTLTVKASATVYVGENSVTDFTITNDVTPSGLSIGDTVTWNPSGTQHGAGTKSGLLFGYDAFTAIQDGVNSVAVGGIVNVEAGTYIESLDINRALSLVGPNAGTAGYGSRVGEALLLPDVSDPNPFSATAEIVVYVSASGVTLDGFTVDGDNPSLTSAVNLNGANIDAAEGIVSYEGVGSITVRNNIVRNTTYTGIDFYNFVSTAGTSNNFITDNLIDNLGGGGYSYGIGVLLYNNFYAEVKANHITNVRVGLQTGNFEQANPGSTASIDGNTISASRRAIFYNLHYSAATPFVIQNNDITAINDNSLTYWDGISISSQQTAVNVVVQNNKIDGSATTRISQGYGVWSTPTTADLTISGGTVTGVDYGVWVNNYEGFSSNALDTHIKVSGVDILADQIGVYVLDSASNTNGSKVSAIVTGDNTITTNGAGTGIKVQGSDASAVISDNDASIFGNVVGIDVVGGSAAITGNHLYFNAIGIRFTAGGGGSVGGVLAAEGNNFNNSIDNGTDIRLDVSAGAVTIGKFNSFAGENYYIDNRSSQSLNFVGGGTTFDVANNFRVEDRMFHALDSAASGVIRWVANNLFVTTPSTGASDESIQRGVNAAASGDTINVEAGTFIENVIVDRAVNLLGAQAGVDARNGAQWLVESVPTPRAGGETIVRPASTDVGYGNLFTLNTSGKVTISGFTLDGNNAALGASTDSANGVDMHAAHGVSNISTGFVENPFNSVTLTDNVFKNFADTAVWLEGDPNPPVGDNLIQHNVFHNIDGVSTFWGASRLGMYFADNVYAQIIENDFTRVGDGVYFSNYFLPNPGAAATVQNNRLKVSDLGLAINNHYQSASNHTLDGNEIRPTTGSTPEVGIMLWSLQSGVGATASNNIIDGQKVGIEAWNLQAPGTFSIQGNTLTNNPIGIHAFNKQATFGNSGGDGTITLAGNSISGSSNVGVLVEANGGNKIIAATFGAGNTIDAAAGAIGLRVSGALASVGGTLSNTAFTQTGTGRYLVLDTGAQDNATINATAATFNGKTGAAATLAENFAIENNITHALDNASVGLVRVKAATLFVTTPGTGATDETIQRAVDAATSGDTINVEAGTFAENVTVNKPLTLQGAQAGNSANTRFAAFTGGPANPKANPALETVITTPVNDPGTPNPGANDLVRTVADNITIDGFVIDGNNAALGASTLQFGVVDIHARRGVTTVDALGNFVVTDGLTIQNNIVQNVAERGVHFDNDGIAPTTAHTVAGNVIRAFGQHGVILFWNAFTNVTNNTIEATQPFAIGIDTQTFFGAGTNAFTGNTISVGPTGVGINVNNSFNAAVVTNITGNTVNAAAGVVVADDSWGINIWSQQNGPTVTLTGNIVGNAGGNFARGINVWNTSNGTVSVVSGSVARSNVGINFEAVEPTYGAGGTAAELLTISGASITGLTTGIRVFNGANPAASNSAMTLNLSTSTVSGGTTGIEVLNTTGGAFASTLQFGAGNSITGGVNGLTLNGAGSAIAGNTLNDLAFTGQSGSYIVLSSGALAGVIVNGTAASFDGLTGATATVAQNFAIEDKITHVTDNSSLGFIRVKASHVFVTTSSGSIQRGVDAAATNDIVYVATGTYTGGINISKSVTVRGGTGNPAHVVIGSAANGFNISGVSSNVTLQDLSIKTSSIAVSANTINSLTLDNLVTTRFSTVNDVVSLSYLATNNDDTIVIDADVGTFSATGFKVSFFTNVGQFSAFGRNGSDTFNVTPPPIGGTAISVFGSNPVIAPGDVLNYASVDGVATQNPTTITNTTRETVTYDNIETVNIAAAIDTTSPSAVITPASDPATGVPVVFNVVFNEDVFGFNNLDVMVGGTANPTTAVVTPIDGKNYTVSVTGMNSLGTVTITLPPGAANDLAGNPSLTASGSVNFAPNPTIVESFKIDSGSIQRSTIRSLTISFSDHVDFGTNALTLDKTGVGGGVVTLSVSASDVMGKTVAVITFPGSFTEFKSLVDGRYSFVANHALVTDPYGRQLDGDANGVAGGNFGSAFHRLFGDANGDATVAANDFIEFRLSLGGSGTIFDFDNDGAVAASDFIQFRLRFGGSI